MKLYKLLIALTLATAVTMAGCGGSDDEQPKPGQPGYNGAAYAPPNANTGFTPYNCGTGQYFNGVTCVNSLPNIPIACNPGYVPSGNTCVPQNLTCPGQQMSWNQTGCDGAGQSVPNYSQSGWYCYQMSYSYPNYYYTCRQVVNIPNRYCVITYAGLYCR